MNAGVVIRKRRDADDVHESWNGRHDSHDSTNTEAGLFERKLVRQRRVEVLCRFLIEAVQLFD